MKSMQIPKNKCLEILSCGLSLLFLNKHSYLVVLRLRFTYFTEFWCIYYWIYNSMLYMSDVLSKVCAVFLFRTGFNAKKFHGRSRLLQNHGFISCWSDYINSILNQSFSSMCVGGRGIYFILYILEEANFDSCCNTFKWLKSMRCDVLHSFDIDYCILQLRWVCSSVLYLERDCGGGVVGNIRSFSLAAIILYFVQ